MTCISISRWSNIALKKYLNFISTELRKAMMHFYWKSILAYFDANVSCLTQKKQLKLLKGAFKTKQKQTKNAFLMYILMRIVFLTFSQGISFCVVRQYLDSCDAIVVLQPNFSKSFLSCSIFFLLRSYWVAILSCSNKRVYPHIDFNGNFPP